MKSSLIIKNLKTSVSVKKILNGITLTVKSGEVHAVMGPNGSGKSTLAFALMGHPEYKSETSGLMKLGKKNLANLSTEERAKAGLFLAMQSPIAIPGVSVTNILREAYQAIYGQRKKIPVISHNPIFINRWQGVGLSLPQFMSKLKSESDFLRLNETFLSRGANEGFSGGEKKKLEMLQALILNPKFAIFDEIDTGLDVDALVVVAKAIKRLAEQGTGVIIITHYQRILKHLKPDKVHILVDGKIARTGAALLAKKIENEGYQHYLTN